MTDEKTCYNCGNKNCNVYYSMVKKDYKRHFETYEYNDFDCVNHNKWEELKMEEIYTDNTKTLQNALERIKELEKENEIFKKANEIIAQQRDGRDADISILENRIEELEKANEWHYPSNGELPKCDEETQLIFYVNCYYEIDGETLTRKRMVLGYYKKAFLRDDEKLFVEKSKGYEEEHLPQAVIAWKEIVFPKEIDE